MQSSKGFTLIELLVVIAIIGLLSSVVLASLNSARASARDARRASDMLHVQLALELYFDANTVYPPAPETPFSLSDVEGLAPAYIPFIPEDPLYGTDNGGYRYFTNDVTGGYTLLQWMERIEGRCRIVVGNGAGYGSHPLCEDV